MKKITLSLMLIFCNLILFACGTQSTPENKNVGVLENIANCYFLLSGDYGTRDTDRNAVLTNTLYHINEANIDSFNAVLPLVTAKFETLKEQTTQNTNTALSNYASFSEINFPNLNGYNPVQLYFNKVNLTQNSYQINGIMFKPEQNNSVETPNITNQEQLVNAIHHKDVTISFEHTLDTEHTQTKPTFPESVYTVNAVINPNTNEQEIILYETNNPKNVVTLNYNPNQNTANFVVTKNEFTNHITLTETLEEVKLEINDFNSNINYSVKQGVNCLNFTFIKTNSTVDSTKTGGGTITLVNNQVNYVLDSNIKFVKALNTIKNYKV